MLREGKQPLGGVPISTVPITTMTVSAMVQRFEAEGIASKKRGP